MSQDREVYDLGDVDKFDRAQASVRVAATARSRPGSPTVTQARIAPGPPPLPKADLLSAVPGSLSVFLPGAGQLLRGDVALGLFFITFTAFIGTVGWAILNTIDRLGPTLELLGYPAAAGVWTLAFLYYGAALLHLGSVLSVDVGEGRRGAVHPAIPGVASLIVPGWGQLLNGQPRRAALFLAGLWVAGTTWILVLTPVQRLMVSLDLYVPRALEVLSMPLVRWTLPAIVWTLAVYDAAASAAHRR